MKMKPITSALLVSTISAAFMANPVAVLAAETAPVAPQTHPTPVATVAAPSKPAASTRAPKAVPVRTVEALPNSPSLPLPGVGVMPGSVEPEMEDNVIRITSNRTEVVNVSGTLTNRIATPFTNPKAILLDGGATVTVEGQSLYVALDGSPDPLALYVTGSEPNSPVVSLTLMPHSLPPQTIVLQLDGLDKTVVGGGGGSSRDDNPNSPIYTERLVSVLRSVALGETPEGFVQGRLPVAAADFGNFTAVPLARFSSSAYDVYRYRLVTESPYTIELEESAFATEGVRAVAFFPSALIAKDVQTEVYIVADKKATVAGGRR